MNSKLPSSPPVNLQNEVNFQNEQFTKRLSSQKPHDRASFLAYLPRIHWFQYHKTSLNHFKQGWTKHIHSWLSSINKKFRMSFKHNRNLNKKILKIQTYKKLERWHEYSSLLLLRHTLLLLLLLHRLRPNKLTTNQKFTEKNEMKWNVKKI